MQESEIERLHRVADMLLSMHSTLRDEFNRQELLLNCSLLAAAVILNGFVFVDDGTLKTLGFQPAAAKVGIGLTSIVVFLISVIELRVGWSEAANNHNEAVKKLATLKGKFRLHFGHEKKDAIEAKQLADECTNIFAELIAIPEADFVRLKHKHLKKKLLSDMVSQNPGIPLWRFKLALLFMVKKRLENGK